MTDDDVDINEIDEVEFVFWCPSCLEPDNVCRCAWYEEVDEDE